MTYIQQPKQAPQVFVYTYTSMHIASSNSNTKWLCFAVGEIASKNSEHFLFWLANVEADDIKNNPVSNKLTT